MASGRDKKKPKRGTRIVKKPGSVATARRNEKAILRAEEAKRDKAFNLEAPGPAFNDTDGKPQILPPLVQMVDDMMLTHTRRSIVHILTQRYECSALTIDRAIRVIKAEYDIKYRQTREERMKESMRDLDGIIRAASKTQKFAAARQTIQLKHKLAGDLDKKLVLDVNLPAEVMLAEAEELRAHATDTRNR